MKTALGGATRVWRIYFTSVKLVESQEDIERDFRMRIHNLIKAKDWSALADLIHNYRPYTG